MNKNLLLTARILHAAFLIFLLIFSLFSCGNDDDAGPGDNAETQTESIGDVEENKSATFPASSPAGNLPNVSFVEMNQTLYGLGQNLAAGVTSKIEVWSSTTGLNWAVETTNIGTNKRKSYAAVSFNGKLWVIGGTEGADRKNDVWSTVNGKDWNREIETAAFTPRDYHHAVVLRDSLYIVGGLVKDGAGTKAAGDIWRTKDGINWSLVTNQFTYNSKVVVLGDAMYAFHKSGKSGTLYKSINGKAWTVFSTFDLPSDFHNERMIVSKESIWVSGIALYDFHLLGIDASGKATSFGDKFKSVSDLFETDQWFVTIDDGFYGITFFQDKLLLMINFKGLKLFTADLK